MFHYHLAFFQNGQAVHLAPLLLRLWQRVCRSVQFRAISNGFLAGGGPCQAWLQPAGTLRSRGSPPPFFAERLQVVAQDENATFVSELWASFHLLPLASQMATVLAQEGRLAPDVPYDFCLFVTADEVTSGGAPSRLAPISLSPFKVRDGEYLLSEHQALSLQPALDRADDVPILMHEAALAESLAYCQSDPEVERGGVFLGYLCRDMAGRLFVEARHFCPALKAEEAATTMRFTRETWEEIHRCRRQLGPELQVVGWSHNHPRVQVEGLEEPLALFLSPADAAIMVAFFDLPHLFAIVVDAVADPSTMLSTGPGETACAVFGWDEMGVSLVRRSLEPVMYFAP